ncbi:MAG: amino acid racemase [Bryobacteraceae bacterium]|jgi:aspartate racemase
MKAAKDKFEGKLLGVLGGMGPMAGAVFMERLTAMTNARCDQEHIPAVLWSDPRVPDRTDARLDGGEDPLPWLLNGIRRLEEAGAHAIVIPCNTAHLWYDQMAAETRLPILHIVEAAIDDLRSHGVSRGRIGLMGSAATLRFGMYQQRLESRGFEWVVPSGEAIEKYCMTAIRLVKANQIASAYDPAAECVRMLKHQGADAVMLGCTELPLAVPHERRRELGIALTDSIDGLAAAAIRWARA